MELSTIVRLNSQFNKKNLGEKPFQLAVAGSDRTLWGVFEGQCDREGNTYGEGRWLCTEGNYTGTTYEGSFFKDKPIGFGKYHHYITEMFSYPHNR